MGKIENFTKTTVTEKKDNTANSFTSLEKCSLFEKMNSDEIEFIMKCFNPKIQSFTKNEYIVLAGNQYKGIGILIGGLACVSKDNLAGNRVIMTLLKPFDIFGEIVAFSEASIWPANVQAQSACEVIFLDNDLIINKCSNCCTCHSKLISNLLKIVSTRALMLNKRVDYLCIKSLRAKIATLLLEYKEKNSSSIFRLPMNRNEMADFLNISRPSMSREMGKMRAGGIIDFQKEAIRILNEVELIKMLDE